VLSHPQTEGWKGKRDALLQAIPWLVIDLFDLRSKETFKENFAHNLKGALKSPTRRRYRHVWNQLAVFGLSPLAQVSKTPRRSARSSNAPACRCARRRAPTVR